MSIGSVHVSFATFIFIKSYAIYIINPYNLGSSIIIFATRDKPRKYTCIFQLVCKCSLFSFVNDLIFFLLLVNFKENEFNIHSLHNICYLNLYKTFCCDSTSFIPLKELSTIFYCLTWGPVNTSPRPFFILSWKLNKQKTFHFHSYSRSVRLMNCFLKLKGVF